MLAAWYNNSMSLKSKLEKIPGYNSLVRPLHWAQAVRAGMKNGWPGKKLRVIGVTGTNGKTSTSFMIWKMLNAAGHRTGLLSTVGWSADGNTLYKQVEHMTTEKVGVLDERMRRVVDAGAEFLVLETTSHALMQSRILGVPIEIAVFTNLTHEHLDYHKTFENYRKAKLKLFKRARYGVVNADDPSADWFVKAVGDYASGDIFTYGIEKGEYRATDIKLSATGVEYSCGDIKMKVQIPGKFNVYNSLAALCVGKRLGLSDKQIAEGVGTLESVEGRMTRVQEGQDFDVIVDYAHTPDALEKVFASFITALDSPVRSRRMPNTTSLRASSLPCTDSKQALFLDSASSRTTFPSGDAGENNRRIIAVHGGAGRRDESTRAERGEILGKYSDVVIITEDDTRDEDPAAIAAMFVEGAKKAGKVEGKDLLVELDRRKAIEKAFSLAKKGDLVLILGKGHEKTILRGDGAHEFEDIKVAKELLS